MKKKLIKTAIISFVAVIALVFTVIGVVSLAAPRKMARLCENVGLKNAAVYYYRADYERDRDINKLADVVDAADFANDDDTLANYGEKLVRSSDFADFCAKKDETKSSLSKISSYDYYCYLVVTSAYKLKKYDVSAEIAVKKTAEYGEYSPLSVAIKTAKDNADKEYAAKIIESYDKYGSTITKNEKLKQDLKSLEDI